jgi:eukaryotic-like serine/threonine-protein kinase
MSNESRIGYEELSAQPNVFFARDIQASAQANGSGPRDKESSTQANEPGSREKETSAPAAGSVARDKEPSAQANGSVVRDHQWSPRTNGPALHAGESVLGQFRLGAVIRRSPAAAVYETEFYGEDGQTRPAVIKVRELDPPEAATAVRQWRGALRLQHPHLLRLYATGSSAFENATAAWVVMERADQSLAAVLNERALSEDEVGEMLTPTVSALAYLHKNGYAHGALKPSNVLAAGDQLKLSCDNVVRVSEGGVPSEDIRALGELIAEALTERGPHGVVRHPSGRFSEILRRCSDPNPVKRWTAEQIAGRLNQKDTELPPEKPAMTPGPQLVNRTKTASRGFPLWVFGGLFVVVLIVLLTAVLRTGNNKPAPVAGSPAATPAVTAVTPAAPELPPAPPPVAQPGSSAAQPQSPVAQPVPPVAKRKPFPDGPRSTTGRKADGWYVIVAAYGSRDAAQKRMSSLAKRWPAFHMQVSEHSSERAPWLVTLGENLSENEADSLRARAIHEGLARDAYIKRIK